LAGDLSSLQELHDHPGGDTIDAALDLAHHEINSQLAEIESRELNQIEKALERMQNGTYGICEVTGKTIPLARLQALPYATVCIEAQRELEESGEADSYEPDWGRILDNGPSANMDDVARLSEPELH
jgi:DnaK suppressor protein